MKLLDPLRLTARLAVLAALTLPLLVAAAPPPAKKDAKSAKPTTAKPAAAAPASASMFDAQGRPIPGKWTHPKLKGWINATPDTGQFLADSVWLLRVGPRVSTVGDYVGRWFAAYPPDRPGQDSVGRVQFLQSMMDKDILALSAFKYGRKLGFEDRHELRQSRQRALIYAVHKKYVTDSLNVTEEQLRKLYESYKYDQHLRHILVVDRNAAELVRREIVSGRMTWAAAAKKYSIADSKQKDGDIGWLTRDNMAAGLANVVFGLKQGEISPPVQDGQGWHVVQSLERRPRKAVLGYDSIKRRLQAELAAEQTAYYTNKLSAILREMEALRFDTTNCVYASQKFRAAVQVDQQGFGGTITVDETVPEFSDADTARVLARWKRGQLTIGNLVHTYHEIPPLMRPTLNVPEIIMSYVESIALEPAIAELGEKEGMGDDPSVKAAVDKKSEELLVNHLFQDSVARYVWVTNEERRAHYKKNLPQYHTYAKVQFAAITRFNKAGADSVAKALVGGADPRLIIAADSARGFVSGSIQERSQADQGSYHVALFEEMRPGDVQVRGPDREGVYAIIKSLAYDPGRQLSYEESEHMIDESLQNMKGEAALRGFIDRHKGENPIAWRPELVLLIKLVDPSLYKN